LPNRPLIFVADSGFAAVELLVALRRHVCLITRLRLDAALYKPAPPRRKGQRGRTPLKGRRRPRLKTVLASKKTIWTTVEVSQWYNAQQRKLQTATGTALWYKAGVPPVPIRWVLVRDAASALRPNAAVWYRKQEPTFSDAIATVRRVLWCPPNLSISRQPGETVQITTALLNRLFQTLCLAA
jgi:hypothetical protein